MFGSPLSLSSADFPFDVVRLDELAMSGLWSFVDGCSNRPP
jgi:hypothetical protein